MRDLSLWQKRTFLDLVDIFDILAYSFEQANELQKAC